MDDFYSDLGNDDALGRIELLYDLDTLQIELADTSRYQFAKNSKVGLKVLCGNDRCQRTFIKKSYQQAFCCNHGRNNCKDSYHNRTAGRIDRTMMKCGIFDYSI